MLKRLFALAVIIALCLSLTACGGLLSSMMGNSTTSALGGASNAASGNILDTLLNGVGGDLTDEIMEGIAGNMQDAQSENSLSSEDLEKYLEEYLAQSATEAVEEPEKDWAVEIPAATEAPEETEAPAEEPAESNDLASRAVGKWQRETMYLEYYGCDADLYIDFYSDGTFYQLVVNAETGAILSEKEGTWTVEGSRVTGVKPGDTGTVYYDYEWETDTFHNGDKTYWRIG